MPSKRRDSSVEEPSDQVRNEGQLSFARLAERRGQPEQAKAIYEAFISKQPDNPLPFHRLGVMAARQGDFKKCDDYLSKAFHLNGDNPELLADIGYSMYLRGLTADAETFYRRALELDHDHEAASNNLGMLLVETGRQNEGLAVFKRVNDDAEAYANQGFILAQTGQLEEAKKYFNHALTVDSSLKQAAKGLMQVAEYQDRSRTAPEFNHERTPERLAATTQPSSHHQAEVVAKPNSVTPAVASMVTIKEKEPAPVAAPRSASSPAMAASSVSSPPAMISHAEPIAVPPIANAQLTNQRAQDISVRNASTTRPIMNTRLPQVIQPTHEDLSPPPVVVQQAPASEALSPPPVIVQQAAKHELARPLPVVIQQSTPRDDASPPPVFVQPATAWPAMPPNAPAGEFVRDRAKPGTAASGVFSTRVSDIAEPMQLPSTQSVPESSMPTTPSRARSRWGENPVRPATMSIEAQQPAQPQSADMRNWAEQPHANLALKSIVPVTQFQPQHHTQPAQSNAARGFNPFESDDNAQN